MLSSTTVRATVLGSDSVGPFAFPFKIFAATDLDVRKISATGAVTPLNYPTDYTVAGIGDAAGGTLTLSVALATGETLAVLRATPNTQPTSLRALGAFTPAALEDEFDRLTMLAQQHEDAIARSVRLPRSLDPATHSLELTPETGKVLGWASSTALTNLTLDSSAIALPGQGRTVATASAYLANNALFNVKDYGATCDGVTDDSAAAQVTVNAAAAAGGGIVVIPACTMVCNSQIIVPAFVRVIGAGQQATIIKTSYAGFLFKVGTTSAVDLAYGCGVCDLAIVCSNAAGGGVWHIGTAGFELANVYIEGSSSTATAVYLDGGNVSNLFAQYTNVIVNHFKFGLHIGTSGSVVPTSLTAVNFNAFCDLISGGIGIQVDALCGNGHRFVGGNLEHCATGISQVGSGTQYTGMRFESNTVDVSFPTGTSGFATSFVGCIGLDTVSDSSGSGYNNNQFVACHKSDGTPFANRIVGPTQANAFAATDIPVQIVGASGQSADYLNIITSGSSTVAKIDHSGNFVLPLGTLEPANFSSGVAAFTAPGSVVIANNASASVAGSYALVWIVRGSSGQSALIAVTGVGSYVIAQNATEFTVTSGNAGTTNVFTSSGNITVENKTGASDSYYVLTFKLL